MSTEVRELTRLAKVSRRKYAERADIGSIDYSRRNVERWSACRYDLLRFCVEYFPNSTGLRPFSDDHRRVIARMESCVLQGGRMANVVYRGFAKTTISENTALWATLYGHRKYVPVFSATDPLAAEIILSIKRELEENDFLIDDFPEVCQAVAALEGKAQRCASQVCEGESTHIAWNADKIVYPTIQGAQSSGAIIVARGLTGSILGLKHKRPDGTQQRPDFVIIDDPQTADSAQSPAQNAKRLDIITRSILKLAGHRTPIACVVNGTVREPDDLMDTLLDQKKSPAWQSERIPMIRKWADVHDTLWMVEYANRRKAFNPEQVGDQQRAHREANEFYRENREAMDAGCEVSWEWCYIEDNGDPNIVPELSAIQHAYNMLIDDGESAFASEMNCQPLRPSVEDSPAASKTQIAERMENIPRGVVPQSMERLTAFIDVQQKALFWMVCAWREDFTGHVVAYGTYPDQKKNYFALRDIKRTIKLAHPEMGDEGALLAALKQFTASLMAVQWKRMDGTVLPIERLIIDAGFMTDTVKDFCEQSPYAATILPSHGKYYGAKTVKMIADYKLDPGERRGTPPYWLLTKGRESRKTRHVLIDTNFWKTFVHRRLKTATGDPACLTLFHDPNGHGMLIDHLTSEKAIVATTPMRTAVEWQEPVNKQDNHWFDCLVGCAVGASIQGCQLSGHGVKVVKAPRPKFSDMQKAKMGAK